MPKGNKGGRRGSSSASSYTVVGATQQQSATQDDDNLVIDDGIDTQSEETSKSLADFVKMTSDEQADLIMSLMNEDVPDFLPKNNLQSFIYGLDGDGKPRVVSDAQLDAMPGRDVYRQVAGIYDINNDVAYSSAQIASQIADADFTLYSDSGGSVYGRGIYFGNDYSEIRNWYGKNNTNRKTTGGKPDSTLMRAKIDTSTNIDYNSLVSMMSREMSSGSKLGRAIRSAAPADRPGLYALAKGYKSSYDPSPGYWMVYDRSCLTMSSRTKHNASDSRW